MRVFISNFGKGNSLWPECLERPAIAAFDDARAHQFWLANDRAGYIDYCINHTKTQHDIAPTAGVASKWFNLVTTVVETEGDIWIHREKDVLWWTRSLPGEAKSRRTTVPIEKSDKGFEIMLYHKACAPWSDKDDKGRPLRWNALHPKARTFLFTEGTLQKLSDENAAYAMALIGGGSLEPWHEGSAWRSASEKAGRGSTSYADDRARAITNMVIQAQDTCKGSNGQQVQRTMKNKEFRFNNRGAMEAYLTSLLKDQDELCALTGLPFDFERDGDKDFRPSLDRIDSNGHYEAGNLQIVCRFANRWKNDDADENFRRLIEAVRTV